MKAIVGVLVVVLALFAAAVAVALRDDDRPAGDPTGSALGLVEEIFPPRSLGADDAREGGATCVEGDSLVIGRGATCSFTVPDGARRVAVRRVVGSGRAVAELVPPGGGLVQSLDSAVAGPDDRDPDRYRLAVVDDLSVMTVRCLGPQPCRLRLGD